MFLLVMQGYLVGNGCIDDQFDGDVIVLFIYGMGFILVDMYKVNFIFIEYRFLSSNI